MRELVRCCRILILGLLAVFMAGAVSASNWPRFRGPNGTGVSDDKDVPVSWNQPNEALLWKTEIPGKGHSCPVVWNGKVFLQTAAADGSTRSLYCINLADGKVLWHPSIEAARGGTHKLSSMASGTVATDGTRVYTPFWDGRKIGIYAYDFSGNKVWERDLGSFEGQHGAGHSPIVHAGKVFFANDQDDKSFLVALDAMDGTIVWKKPREARSRSASYATPCLLAGVEHPWELVVLSSINLAAYDPETGSEIWKSGSGLSYRTVGSTVFSHGMFFVGTGTGGGARHAVAFKLDRTQKPAAVTVAWEEKKSLPYVPSMLVRGDHLYYVNDRGVAGCCLASTGKPVWTERVSERTGGNVYASPLLVDGRIYAVTTVGEVVVVAAEPKFQLLGRSSIGPDEEVLSTPAVADSCLLIRGREHLYCFGKRPPTK